MKSGFISFHANDSFSGMNKSDLQELLLQLNTFYLEYRYFLGLESDLSFGAEIEYEDADISKVHSFVKNSMGGVAFDYNGSLFNKDLWFSKKDGSLHHGGEVVSPIMYDNKKYWLELKQICEFLKEIKATTHKECAGHIHFGANIFGNDYDSWRRFLKIYTIYENVLFRFGYGQHSSARRRIHYFSAPLANFLNSTKWQLDRAKKIEELSGILPLNSKHHAINFRHVHFSDIDDVEGNTIEFRFLNGSTEECIWQNNINVLAKLILTAKNKNLDEDYLDALLRQQEMLYFTTSTTEIHELYEKVCLKQALDFADLIFDNNLDKIYFLKQYIGHEDVKTLTLNM